MLSKRDPVASALALMRVKGDQSKKERKRLFQEQSPMRRMQNDLRNQLEESFRYRLSVLKAVGTFASFGGDENLLRRVAENMETIEYVMGDDIIVQNDIGDAFFVLEMGRVKVMRKANAYEAAHEIRQLGKGAHFGELSLLNEEPRTATITVISETARALKLSKTIFDEICKNQRNNLTGIKRKELAGKDVTEKVPLFKSLSAALKKKIVETMQNVSFAAGSIICKQGTTGNTFYVVTSGCCKITIDTEDSKEKEVNKIYAGDFFGEAALVDASSRRTANVIAVDNVTCMSLSKAEFNYLLKGVKTTLVNSREKKRLSDLQALGKLKRGGDANAGGANEKTRRISALDSKGQRNEQRVSRYVKCCSRYVFESLHLSLYARLYRMFLLREILCADYGELAHRVTLDHDTLATAVVGIRGTVIEILGKDNHFRTQGENLFIAALLRQRNQLKDKLCVFWSSSQYNELMKHISITRIKATKRIFEVGQKGSSFYVILRGCVRLFSQVDGNARIQDSEYEAMVRNLKPERDLFPGDVFGEEIVKGERIRKITALAVSGCDLATIDIDTFMRAQDAGGSGLSLDDRVTLVNKVTIFKGWDQYRLYKVAHCVEQIEFNKGTVILDNEDISNKIYVLLSGSVDVYANARSKNPLNALSKYDYFGETGFLNTCIHTKSSSFKYTETFCLIAQSRVLLLVFPENEYHLIDGVSAMKIQEAYNIRKSWREQRVADVRNEKQVFRNMEKSLNSACQALTTLISKGEEEKISDRPHTAVETLEKVSTIIRASSAVPRSLSSGHSMTEMSVVGGWNFDPDSMPMTYHSNGPPKPSTPLPMSLGIASRPSTTLPPSMLPTSSSVIPHRMSGIGYRPMTAGTSFDGGSSTDVMMNNVSLGALPIGVSAGDSIVALEGLSTQLSQTLSTMVSQYKEQHMVALLGTGTSSSNALLARAPPPDLSLRGAIGHPSSSSSHISNMAAMSTMARFTVREPMASIDSLNVPMRKVPNKAGGMRLQDLEDIPSLVNGGFDPFMVISTSKNYRKVAKNQEAVAYLRLPKCARAKDLTKDNGAYFREASRQRSREHGGLGMGPSEMSMEHKEGTERGDNMVREWNQILSEGLGLNNADRLTLGGDLDDDEVGGVDDEEDIMVKNTTGQESTKPIAIQPLGIAELSPSILALNSSQSNQSISIERLDDTIAADILSSNAPIRTSIMDTAINKALRTSEQISLNTPRTPTTPRPVTANDPPPMNSSVVLGAASVVLGAELEVSMSAASIVSNNPDEYVGSTGHEAHMLFGSGKIPGVKSFCQLLNPIERAPFASNVRPPVTNKDLSRMDLELQAQLDEQKKTNAPAGPRLTKLERMKRISAERKKVKSPNTTSIIHKEKEIDPKHVVATLSKSGGIKFDDDDDEGLPTLASSLGLIALPNNRNRAIHLAASPFSMGTPSGFDIPNEKYRSERDPPGYQSRGPSTVTSMKESEKFQMSQKN